MKIRSGFVSNSSSSSFIVALSKLTEKDKQALLDYNKLPEESIFGYRDIWNMTIDEEKGIIRGFTIMDNCNLIDYLREKSVDTSVFTFDEY